LRFELLNSPVSNVLTMLDSAGQVKIKFAEEEQMGVLR
jgi:hypothetical protein